MEYRIAKPSSLLSKYVKHYWTINNCIPDNQQHIQRIVPSGLPDLIFYFHDRPVYDNTQSVSENALISGQLNTFYDIHVTGKLSLFSILFKPQGLSMFFDIPLNELYNQNVPLKFLIRQDAHVMEAQLFEADSFQERTRIAENYLLMLLQKKKNAFNLDRIEHSMHLINSSKGLVNIDYLASEACFSRKQFERVFTQYIGATPKQFLKIIRFQHAIDLKSKNANTNLADLTYSCGYYDQSHMTNEFQRLSGMTPKQYFDTCKPYSDYFQ